MLKPLAISASVLTLAACATVSPTQEIVRHTALAPAASLGPAAASGRCVPATASRIPVKGDECGAFGQTYTRQDLLGTGQTDIGPALQMLDPAVTVHGH